MPTNRFEPDLRQIYEKTYGALLDKLPKEMKDKVLAEVGKNTKPPRDVADFIEAVAMSAESQYDGLVAANKKTLKSVDSAPSPA